VGIGGGTRAGRRTRHKASRAWAAASRVGNGASAIASKAGRVGVAPRHDNGVRKIGEHRRVESGEHAWRHHRRRRHRMVKACSESIARDISKARACGRHLGRAMHMVRISIIGSGRTRTSEGRKATSSKWRNAAASGGVAAGIARRRETHQRSGDERASGGSPRRRR